jgi:hypothetical protein
MRLNDLDYLGRSTARRNDAYCERPGDLVVPMRIDPTGEAGPTRHQVAGPRFRQTSPGLYVPAEVEAGVVEQRILEQGMRIRKHGAVTGWAALRWRGAAYFSGLDAEGEELPVPLAVGLARLREDPRVAISQAQMARTEYTSVAGIQCASVQRALFDEMRWAAGDRAATVALEKATAARLISVGLMSTYVAQRPAWTGVEQVRRALALGSNDSRSPQETLMRLVWLLDARLTPPLCNVPVFTKQGRLIGYPDLLDVELGVIGEYNGAEHVLPERRRRDAARDQDFRNHGLECFAVVGGELSDRYAVSRRMLDACERAKAADRPRSWTLTPPPWWGPEEDLDHYLVRVGLAPYLVRT